MMKTILITGGLGYIGSHAAVVFGQAGYEIVLVDNLSNSKIEVLDKLETLIGKKPIFYNANIKNKSDIEPIFQNHTIDGVIHFAAFKAVGESCEQPFMYYHNNIIGGMNLYETMLKYNVRNIVFSSSCTVYDTTNNQPPYDESTPLKTINPYGSTKLMSEIILQDLAAHKGLEAIALRYFNPIGAHPSGLIGEDPQGIPNNLLPYIYRVADGQYEYLNIRGDDYPTPDGTCIRDYLHVVDLAEAHLSAYIYLEKQEKKSGFFDIINLGTGQGTSVFEMVKDTEEIIGKKLSTKIGPRRPGDAVSVYANPTKAEKLLGRKSKRTVKDAVADGWNFITNQK